MLRLTSLIPALANILLLSAPSHGRLLRDDLLCPAQTWNKEFFCYREQNSMYAVIREITADLQDGSEDGLCRRYGEDPTFREDQLDFYIPGSSQGEPPNCFKPRALLLYGTQASLGLQGAMKACPLHDPNFFECLCTQDITDAALELFATQFRRPVREEILRCDRFARRPRVPRSELDTLGPLNFTVENDHLRVSFILHSIPISKY
jgi:hypothetical protein